jgi:DNA (cytosine-5)-methyltransferase 1
VNVLSLFSGIGGLDLGLERAGMTVVGQVEIDPWCRRVLAKHWPEVPRHDDVRTAARWWLARPRPVVDLICGGIPCQPHSVAGLRLGTDDPRWLGGAFLDVAERLEPRLILLENSPRLRTSGLRDILTGLARLGFDAWWSRVPAAAMGAPHLRWRLILVAAHPDRVELREQPGGSGGAYGQSQAVTGFDGAAWAVADPDGDSGDEWRPCDAGEGPRGRDADRGAVRADGVGGPGGDFWGPEPRMGRVADGVPARVDRLRGIGNAVVPQVAEYVGRLILAAERAA